MKHTQYFIHTRSRPHQSAIIDEWINQALVEPIRVQTQSDGRIRFWVFIPEAGRYLRVMTLADGETVHNAFFDRTFKESPA